MPFVRPTDLPCTEASSNIEPMGRDIAYTDGREFLSQTFFDTSNSFRVINR